MSTTYSGDGTVPSATRPWNRQAISSSTNTSPIQLVIPSHGFNSGDTISVEGHLTNTNANGLHSILRIDANTISLNGTTGTAAGGATGYALDYEVQPQITIPSDGDLVNASSVDPALEASRDIIPYLFRRAGRYSLFDVYHNSQSVSTPTTATNGPGGGSTLFTIPNPTSGAWHDYPNMTALIGWGGPPDNPGEIQSAIIAGDLIEVALEININAQDSVDGLPDFAFALSYESNGGSYATLSASQRLLSVEGTASGGNVTSINASLALSAFIQATTASTFNFGLQYWPIGGIANGNTTLSIPAAWRFLAKHYRLNT